MLLFQLPPLSDYVNHLARCYLIAIGDRDPFLSQFYAIDWHLIPNLAMDLIVPPLAHVFNIYIAGKIFLVVTMVLLIAGPHLIYHALYRRWSFGPLLATLFLYNGATSAGTVNYLFGIGVALIGIAVWIQLQQRPAALRATVSAGFVVALFVSHFGALGLYGVALLGLEVWQARRDGSWRQRMITLFVPFLLVPLLSLLGPASNDLITGTLRWTLYDKIRGFVFVIESQPVNHVPDVIVAAVMVILGLWALRRRMVEAHPAAFVIAGLGVAVFLVTPVEIMSAWGADVRQPIGYLFILIGFLNWRLSSSSARKAFLVAAVCLLVARTAVVAYGWERLDAMTVDMQKSFSRVNPGSKILIAEVDGEYNHWLHYLPCELIIQRKSLCSLAFSDPGQQILVVKPEFREITGGLNDDPPALSQLISPPKGSPGNPNGRVYWRDWANNYDYLYLLSADPADTHPLPETLHIVYNGQGFRLYRIQK
ncbi:MAG TPA: hypothetical protein VGU20_11230 [Stellaceae bacterium]|nr:hypothetical protein [Stellaceae bacterium]